MLTDTERAHLRHQLIMDDNKPWKVWQLSDTELIYINKINDEYSKLWKRAENESNIDG